MEMERRLNCFDVRKERCVKSQLGQFALIGLHLFGANHTA